MKKLFILLLIPLSVFISCSRRTEISGPVTELRYGVTSEPSTLDPLSPSNSADGNSILFNVFEGLVKPDTGGNLLPCLAELAKSEDSGRIYSFRLRENVFFHDGSVLTSDDVLFSLETAKEAGFSGFNIIEYIETDGSLIHVVLSKKDPDFLPYLTVGIVKANSVNRDKNAVGTGPYFIESYNTMQSLVLRKFDNYWQDNIPNLEKITVVFFADSDALVLGLYAGSIDGAGLPGALAMQLNPERFDLFPGFSAMVQLLALNNAVPPFNDIRVRQAINYGIDIQGIIDAAFYGKGEPSGSPLIPGLSAYYEKSLADPYPADKKKALTLLEEAGYGDFSGLQKLSLTITVPSNFTMHVDTAQVISAQLAGIGVNANIALVDWATWLSDVYFGRNYQSTIISLNSPNTSAANFLSRYHSGSMNNFINFSSGDFDSVFEMILSEADEEKRMVLHKEAQKIISDSAASVFIQDILGFQAFRAGAYGGVLFYPLYVIDFARMYGK